MTETKLPGPFKVVVYSKQGCHLCERVIMELEMPKSLLFFDLSIKDITTEPALLTLYGSAIPVVEIDSKVRLAGATLANSHTVRSVLQKALFGLD